MRLLRLYWPFGLAALVLLLGVGLCARRASISEKRVALKEREASQVVDVREARTDASAKRDTLIMVRQRVDTVRVQAAKAVARVDSMLAVLPAETLAVTPAPVRELVDSLRSALAQSVAVIDSFRVERVASEAQHVADAEALGRALALAETRRALVRETEKLIPNRARVWTERIVLLGVGFEAGRRVARR